MFTSMNNSLVQTRDVFSSPPCVKLRLFGIDVEHCKVYRFVRVYVFVFARHGLSSYPSLLFGFCTLQCPVGNLCQPTFSWPVDIGKPTEAPIVANLVGALSRADVFASHTLCGMNALLLHSNTCKVESGMLTPPDYP